MALPEVPTQVHDPCGRVYSVERQIGKGAFASVHRARVNGALMALKAVKTHGLSDKVSDKFRTELQIHSKLRHRHIVAFHRAFSLKDNTYISLELCQNGTLKEMISNRGCLSPPEIRRLGLQLCGALHHIHQRSVIHRDIKAANIFLDSEMCLKLGDFGLAGILLTDEEIGEVQRRVTVCGTPNYIAPEVLSKKRGHVTKADIWSLGVLFFHMMTGQMPFSTPEDKNNTAVFNRVAAATFTWPEKNANQLPEDAKDLVLSLLQKEEDMRPSAVEVAQNAFFKSNTIPARLDSTCMTQDPTWLKLRYPREMRASAPKISHEELLKQCGLVPINASGPPPALYHTLFEEVNQGEVPQLPLKGVYERKERLAKPPQKKKPLTIMTGIYHKAKDNMSPKRSTSSASTLSGPTALFSQTEGTALRNNSPKATLMKDVLQRALKGHLTKPGPIGELPPIVIYSCEQIKWGTGFVLSDGSIGILSSRRSPAKMVVVSAALPKLLLKSQNEPKLTSSSKSGPIPPGLSCFFYEQDSTKRNALSAGTVPPTTPIPVLFHNESSSNYQTLAPGSDGSKLKTDGPNQSYNERCHLLNLWLKFAKYMVPKTPLNLLQPNVLISAFLDPAQSELSVYDDLPTYKPEPRLLTVQTLGNVRAWAWSNGGIQLDYPDGGKVALSSCASRTKIIYWPTTPSPSPSPSPAPAPMVATPDSPPASITEDTPPFPLAAVGAIKGHSTSQRSLNLELNTLLSNHLGDDDDLRLFLAPKLAGNGIRPKLEFMRDVLIMWSANGGVGNAGGQKLAYTLSESEEGMKEVWVTGPARERREMRVRNGSGDGEEGGSEKWESEISREREEKRGGTGGRKVGGRRGGVEEEKGEEREVLRWGVARL
ncbi:Cell cycle serine/threonine-protein kinase cdc5/MSD2 [Thelotrema lepadinum]|nr:Cell cycle serine/threonine-protein kinase cdc5/MSD2 [Thelotrema lepadinum]